MKNTINKIALLSLTLFLASCNQNTDSTKESSLDSSSNSVSQSAISESSETTNGITTDKATLTWSESDLSVMSEYLNGYTSLPFPIGFTSSYVEASGTDEDEECFIVYDSNCGDLSESYGKQLIDSSFTYDEEDSGDGYYYYYLSLEDSNDEIWVQIDYYQTDFEIFAWVEISVDNSATFPYDQIATFYSLSTVDENILPSFALASGEEYDIYPSGTEYLLIGGIYDTTIEEATYVSDYEAKLTKAGYTVDSANGSASNTTYSISLMYMAMSGYFSIQLSR